MKQRRNMCLLLGLLVVLIVLYLGLNQWNKSKEEEQAKQEEEDTIYLTDAEDLTAFQYTNGETTLGFVKEEDTWYLEDDADTALTQSKVEEIVSAIEDLTATRKLDNPDALSDYGLEEAAYTVNYTADGETKTIYIGNISGEEYYATTDGKEDVYTISSELVSAMSFDLTDFVEETEDTDSTEDTE